MGKGKNKQRNNDAPQNESEEVEKAPKECKDISLQVHMHCDGCATKLSRCLRGFDGVEEVKLDRDNNKVTVRGEKADPTLVLERVRKKCSPSAELISPKPKAPVQKKPDPPKEEEIKVVILKIYMHCEGCARDVKKNIGRLDGVLSVEPDMSKSQVSVKGGFDPPVLAETITKRLGKFVEIVKQEAAVIVKNQKKNKREDNNNNSSNNDNNNNNNQIQYSPQNFYSCLSDESLHSCCIM